MSTAQTAPENSKHKRLRLNKQDKLRFKSQFEQIRRDGVKSVAPGMVVVVAPSPEERLECGVICSKKYSLLSVVRNRARRLMWESFRILKPDLSPCRILLIPRHRMKKYNRQQTTAELTEILIKQQVLAVSGDIHSLP
ncbi:MAG: ribonuclease P protein component [Lentisphaeria bacterium]|nr:ribonuclease P protein component [Lentisphaeria bacterium]MBR2720158.1 ribonuclease P protein component [Lentisphaeria bacterium]